MEVDEETINSYGDGTTNSYEKIDYYSDYYVKPQESSRELNELFTALAKAQSMMKPAKTSSNNPFFKSKYAPLESIVSVSREALCKQGLCVIQYIRTDRAGNSLLCTRVGHSSGQWIDSWVPIKPPKNDIQSFGSYLTYLRRYSYAASVGVVTEGEDDDGEKAMNRKPQMSKTVDRMKGFERSKV